MSLPPPPRDYQYPDAESSAWQLVMGSLFLGAIMDTLFLGIVLCQALYWKLHLEKNERWPVRLLVYWMVVGSLAHSCWNQAFGWSVFVVSYGDPLSASRGVWIKGELVAELVLVLPIEVFYAVRAYQLWGQRRLVGVGLSLLLLLCVSLSIAAISLGDPDPVGATTTRYFIAWAISLLLVDWVLSGLIVIGLAKKRSGLENSDRLVQRIIKVTAEAQLVPSLITLGLVIKVIGWPGSMTVLAFIWIPKVWMATALMVINYRKVLRRDVEKERERLQNTLSVVPANDEHLESGVQGGTIGTLPTISFSDKADQIYLSELPTKSHSPSLGSEVFSPLKSTSTSTSMYASRLIPWRIDESNLHVTVGEGRRASTGGALGFGIGLGRFGSRGVGGGRSQYPDLTDAEDGTGGLSFEDMLNMRT